MRGHHWLSDYHLIYQWLWFLFVSIMKSRIYYKYFVCNWILCRHKYVQFYVEVAGSKLNIGIVCINNVEASLSRSLQNISYCKLWFVLVKVALLWRRWWRFSRLPLIFQSDCFNWHHLDNPRARSQVLRIGR